MSKGMLWQGFNRAGWVSWLLAKSPGGEVPGQVDTSFPASEFKEWLLGKLDRNPSEPSYSPGLLPFILKLLSILKILNLLSLPRICARLWGVGVELGEVGEMTQMPSCPPGAAGWS